ncbi:MAG TPA: F0F1 ATP synthase subunit A [Candidatus Synoicihabitans sp.]|nr:F0F1 ATP synthase subunit A [Candidatus Synoicihabitans sp.]
MLLGASVAPAQAAVGASATRFEIFGLPVTNSILTTWAVAIVLLIVVRLAIGSKPRLVPSRGQAVIEGLIDGVKGLIEPIVGKRTAPAALPLLLTLFVFILINNWSGLLPGVGTIGLESHGPEGEHYFEPFIRPFTADMNGTIALAAVAMAGWLFLILKYAGPKLIIHDLFGNKANRAEVPAAIYYFLTLIFLAVGLIEVISIAIRPVSLSFRLFGNVFGGESLLHGTAFAFPFYFLELLIGLVQALVFTLLVSVYIGLICNHGDEHEHAGEGAHGAAAHH